ncbi:ribonuclease R [Desulfovibrio sp. X2]|uniref:ribonuclease R n=1 Tax=Desulfovibrio sp. X2 TaxID=941449 RepID=UPI000358ABD9|nr:ribonuclease R [Desulfovibrio sp. X2]EPR40232.1 ribonuclease R [Desulfovibrio sp. X2]
MAKRNKPEAPPLEPKEVLGLMRRTGKPMTPRDLLKAFRLPKQEKHRIFTVMDELVSQGKVIATHGNAYGLVEQMNLLTGRLQVQRTGVGFVIPEDPRRKVDIFVAPGDFGGAWHGDRVVVAVTRERHGRNPAGRIVRVIERRLNEIPCRTERPLGKGFMLCQPTDPRQHAMFMVPFPEDGMPGPGIIVHVRPGERLDRELWQGESLRVLGKEDDVGVQETMVKHNHGIPTSFPPDCLEEAASLPEAPSEEDMTGRGDMRRDLRDLDFVTIDGAKARDFDDAVYVERKGRGYTLWVAIADVAHYVQLGSPLDREAVERGNSYYFPQSVEPMFPKALSNGLCSLNPDVPRLAMVAQMDFSAQGKPGESRFYAAVIKSKARLTYSQVNRGLILGEEEARAGMAHVMPMLERAYELARILNANRRERGSLDFDLPEPEIQFNIYGETVDIRPKVRHFGHQIIEEFMIAANEAVAEFLESAGPEPLFRVHEQPDPDKIRALYKVLAHTELADRVPEEPSPAGLQALLSAAQGTDVEFMVNRLTLRTMMQAKYSPDNLGHFGLASTSYCHFTSPIRRYADLQVHRALRRALSLPGGADMPHKKLRDLGNHLSGRERTAMEAEREMLKRVTVLFLRDKVGQEFSGVVSGLADFGFWVELSEVMAEGMVRLSALTDDYYGYLPERQMLLGERTGRRFTLGQSVRVLLEEVNLARLEVTLVPVEDAGRARGRKGGAARGRAEAPQAAGETLASRPGEAEELSRELREARAARRTSRAGARAAGRTGAGTGGKTSGKTSGKTGGKTAAGTPPAKASDRTERGASDKGARESSGRKPGKTSGKTSGKAGGKAGGKTPKKTSGKPSRAQRKTGKDSGKGGKG